jgi:hypothetical protein
MIFGRHIAVTIMQAVFISLLLVIPVSGQTIDNEAGFVQPLNSDCINVNASGEYSSTWKIEYGTDGLPNTRWLSDTLPAWYECEFAQPVTLKSYGIRSSSTYTYNPDSWSVEYYDGSSWQIAETVATAIEHTNTSQTIIYNISGDFVSSRWRINISDSGWIAAGFSEIFFDTVYRTSTNDSENDVISNPNFLLSNSGETIDFDIQAGGFEIVGKWLADIQVCIDDGSIMDCKTNPAWSATMNDNLRYSGIASYLLDYTKNHSVTITTSGYMEFDGINVIQQSTIYSSGGAPAPTATPNVTPTPAPYVYNQIDTPDGIVNTRFDYTATAGDTAIATALLFLFFSMWAMIIMWLFVVRRR